MAMETFISACPMRFDAQHLGQFLQAFMSGKSWLRDLAIAEDCCYPSFSADCLVTPDL